VSLYVCCWIFYVYLIIVFFFFFSSRRRHTRFSRDWSSDVCSSDLGAGDEEQIAVARLRDREAGRADEVAARRRNDRAAAGGQGRAERKQPLHGQLPARPRSAASQGSSIGTSTKATLQSPKTLTASLAVPAGAGKSLWVKG